jgi:hypothetical protein
MSGVRCLLLIRLQAYLNVAFDNAELRVLNAANIDCDITFMQVRVCAAWSRLQPRFLTPPPPLSQFLECLVAVAAKMEKSDDVSLAIKVSAPHSVCPTLCS